MCAHGWHADRELLRDLYWMESLGKGHEYLQSSPCELADDALTAYTFLCLDLLFLRADNLAGAGIGGERCAYIFAQAREGHLDQAYAFFRPYVQDGPIPGALAHHIGRVDVPHVIVNIKTEDRRRQGEDGHEATPAGDGEVDDAVTLFKATYQVAHGIEHIIGACLIVEILQWLPVVAQDMVMEVDDLVNAIMIAGELLVEKLNGAVNTRRGWVYDMHFANRDVALQEQIEREGHDLRLPAHSRQ